MAGPSIPDMFFTLEYNAEKACFLRMLPEGTEDLGNGLFSIDGKIHYLPEGTAEAKILEQKEIRGKDLLALARRGSNPLIKSGPLMAEREDRLMELGLLGGPLMNRDSKKKSLEPDAADILIILRMGKIPADQWLPLDGLPNYRFFGNRIYEVIPDEILTLFTRTRDRPPALLLSGKEIPAFADDFARLIYVFADEHLYQLLSQDNFFIGPNEVSLVFYCEPEIRQGVGKPVCCPVIKYRDKMYSALELSRHFHDKYIPLKDRWIRRETLEQKGIGPLGCFINGESLASFQVKSRDFLAGKSNLSGLMSFPFLADNIEPDKDRWIRDGREDAIFKGHLEFLRHWGISGGIIADQEKAGMFLTAWLASLPAQLRVLLLMPKSFFNEKFSQELQGNGKLRFRYQADFLPGTESAWDLSLPGIDLEFFENFAESAWKRRNISWDIFFTAGLDEVIDINAMLFRLKTVSCRLRLGLFFSAAVCPLSESLKNFFQIQGGCVKYEKYLIRQTTDFLPFPASEVQAGIDYIEPVQEYNVHPGSLESFSYGGACFLLNAKFQNLPVSLCHAEQEEFFNAGENVIFRPIPAGETVSYPHLSETEKEYFLYWRNEFRNGRAIETSPAYIFIYARELILRMDVRENGDAYNSAAGVLDDLYRLMESYGGIFPNITGVLPGWILDFAIMHHVEEKQELSSIFELFKKHEALILNNPGLPLDLFLFDKYVKENHSLEYRDFIPLLGKKVHRLHQDLGALLVADMEEALNRADRTLRKNYGKKLLEFFYPLPSVKKTFRCFDGLPDSGYTAYTVQWYSYSSHKPFLRFLSSLVSFIEYRLLKNAGNEKAGNALLLPQWKNLCGFEESTPELPEQYRFNLETDKIQRLREESDAVMEMLKVEKDLQDLNEPDNREAVISRPDPIKSREPLSIETQLASSAKNTGKRQSTADFIAALDGISLGCLDLLALDKSGELEDYARNNDTMAEFIIDEINQKFLREYGDLLINSLDEKPVIQEEYKDEVLWALTFRNG